MMQSDMLERCTLIEAEPLNCTADALVVEDDGTLMAARGLAAQIDDQYPELRAQREQAVAQRGGPLPLGSAVPCRTRQPDQRIVIWVVTWQQVRAAEPGTQATPLIIEAVTRHALHAAVELGAMHVALPALGTRIDQHVLPPVPKKLPRYVMGTAQLVGIRSALEQHARLRVTVCLTQRDLAIWNTLLGQATDNES